MKTLQKYGFLIVIGLMVSSPLRAQMMAAAPVPDTYVDKNRVFVLTDVGNEPDDQMSFIRLVLYSNVIDIEGVAAVTSNHLAKEPKPELLEEIVDKYAQVRPNLLQHGSGWPSADELRQRITVGPRVKGLQGIDAEQLSSAAASLIAAVDANDPRPLWVSIWGGANTLAEALMSIRDSRSPEQLRDFVAKLRVYSISDQDDSGPWIRREFPGLFYVVTPAATGDDYAYATWTGIGGEKLYGNDRQLIDSTYVEKEWLDANIRKGPLGSVYPEVEYIMEGDSPSFLSLINNGLNSAMSPSWGGWGGRYVFRQPYGESRPIWTQGGVPLYGSDSRDQFLLADGRVAHSDQATIWRWRKDFQNDFAARMDWTVKSPSQANHSPIALIKGYPETGPIIIDVEPNEEVILDASISVDMDKGQNLEYNWFHYPEAGTRLTPLTNVEIANAASSVATVKAPHACRPMLSFMNVPCNKGQAHIILEVSDSGVPTLTSYRRVIIRVEKK